jgi:hypothetical protein
MKRTDTILAVSILKLAVGISKTMTTQGPE